MAQYVLICHSLIKVLMYYPCSVGLPELPVTPFTSSLVVSTPSFKGLTPERAFGPTASATEDRMHEATRGCGRKNQRGPLSPVGEDRKRGK